MYQQYKAAVERGDEEGVVVRLVMFRRSLYVQFVHFLFLMTD